MNVFCESGVHAYSGSSTLYTNKQKTLMHKKKKIADNSTYVQSWLKFTKKPIESLSFCWGPPAKLIFSSRKENHKLSCREWDVSAQKLISNSLRFTSLFCQFCICLFSLTVCLLTRKHSHTQKSTTLTRRKHKAILLRCTCQSMATTTTTSIKTLFKVITKKQKKIKRIECSHFSIYFSRLSCLGSTVVVFFFTSFRWYSGLITTSHTRCTCHCLDSNGNDKQENKIKGKLISSPPIMDLVAFEWSLLQNFRFVKSIVPTLSHTFSQIFRHIFSVRIFVHSRSMNLYSVFFLFFPPSFRSFPSPAYVCA